MSLKIGRHNHIDTTKRAIQKLLRVRPEENFADVRGSICFVSELMSTCKLEQKVEFLDNKIKTLTLNEPFSRTVERLITSAFDLPQQHSACSFWGSPPGGLPSGNFYNGFINVYDNIAAWQRPILHAAFREMLLFEPDNLMIMCGLVLQASRECNARKQFVFELAISRCVPDTCATTVVGNGSENMTVEQHKSEIFEASRVPIDDIKDKAFRNVFLEPSEMYFRSVGDYIMEGDVDVHGSNIYLALLLETIHVKLNRSPLLSDEVKGVCEFDKALRKEDMEQLWNPDNLGKNWEAIIGRQNALLWPTHKTSVERNRFYFPGNSVKQVVDNFRKSRDNKNNHAGVRSLKPYLQAFANHFSEDRGIERVCNYLKDQDSLLKNLNAVFVEIASVEEIEEAEGDVRFWIWNVKEGLGEFRKERALSLLKFVNICH